MSTAAQLVPAAPTRLLVASLVLVLASGCTTGGAPAPSASPDSPSPSASPLPTQSPSPSAGGPGVGSPSPSPSPGGGDPVASPLTCDDLLSDDMRAHIAENADEGLAFREDYGEAMIEQGNVVGRFVELGGVACLFGYPDTDNIAAYGYSSIDATEIAEVQSTLQSQGYQPSGDPPASLWCGESGDCYRFADGAWFWGSEQVMLDMVMSEAAQL